MIKFASIVLIFFILGCQEQHDPTTIRLNLNWFPEAEHGGFYSALVHGYYKEEGLNVKIISGGPGVPVLQKVARQKVAFAVANADRILLARAQQAKIIALLAPISKSPRCIMFHKSSPIKQLKDLKNMTLIMSSAASFSHYVKHKLPLEGVKIIPYTGNITAFVMNKNSAQQAYIFSEPFVAQSKGIKVKNLLVADELGFNPYTSVLVTSEEYAKKYPEIVKKMINASRKGWKKYLENPRETNKYIHSINKQMSMEILKYGAKALTPLVLDGRSMDDIGIMEKKRWTQLITQMEKAKMIPKDTIKVDNVFRSKSP